MGQLGDCGGGIVVSVRETRVHKMVALRSTRVRVHCGKDAVQRILWRVTVKERLQLSLTSQTVAVAMEEFSWVEIALPVLSGSKHKTRNKF